MKHKRKLTYALITGGSQGIGKSIAVELAERGFNLLLVALHDDTLENARKELHEKYHLHVDIRVYGTDLTEETAATRLYDWCHENDINVQILVNNAGFGYTGRLNSYSIAFLDKLVHLNIVAVVNLTRVFIDDLAKYDEAYILNVGSIASYYDTPYKAVYAASKRFVYSFSRAIRAEFKSLGVRVSVLTPAGVMTNENVKKAAGALGWTARLISYTPDEVAKTAVKGMFANKAIIIPGFFNKIYIGLRKILPAGLTIWMLARQFEKKNVPVYNAERLEIEE